MSDQWTERLSEYLDGELTGGERQALAAHLETCAVCRDTLAQLRRVVARAHSLDDAPPARDLWPPIARGIGQTGPRAATVVDLAQRRERRRLAFTVPQLAAAAIALMFVSGGAAWMLSRGSAGPDRPVARQATPLGQGAPAEAGSAVLASATAERYDAAVAQLQQTLDRQRERLDTATVRVLEKNLAIIDRAIAEARAALAVDPASQYLNYHLARTMQRKLELLRRANALAAEQT